LGGGVTGIDISPTAIKKAQDKFYGINFSVADIRKKGLEFINKNYEQFDLIILKEIIWYVIPELNLVIDNVDSLLQKKGYLIVSNFFPPLEKAFYGKDVIKNPEALFNLFRAKRYSPIYFNVLNRFNVSDEGPLVICMYRKDEKS